MAKCWIERAGCCANSANSSYVVEVDVTRFTHQVICFSSSLVAMFLILFRCSNDLQ